MKNLKQPCPVCGRLVEVWQPGGGCSPWYVRHAIRGEMKIICGGSLQTAVIEQREAAVNAERER